MTPLTLTYSLADQDFARTKSIGIFNVSLQLARALATDGRIDQFSVLSNPALRTALALPPGVEVRECPGAVGGHLQRILWDQWQVYSEARRTGARWLFLPKGFASFLRVPPLHLAAYVHDMMHDVYASEYPGEVPLVENHYFRRSMLATLRHARLVFTNTEFTAHEVRRVARKYGLTEPQVCCAGIGFDPRPKSSLPRENRVVALTARWPHKRADLAVNWLQRWQDESGFEGHVDLIGALPRSVPCPPRAQWLHSERLTEPAYRELLQQARVLVYFSDHEGFGMPPVEALLAGACPVFSSIPPTLEAMREAGLPFSNSDYKSFKLAMDQALNVTNDTIAHWAERLLDRHRWSSVAGRVIDALREAG